MKKLDKKIQLIINLIIFIVSIILVFWGFYLPLQGTDTLTLRYTGLGLMFLGIAGILFLLYCYNEKYK